MAFGTQAVANDPQVALTDGQPQGEREEREHDRLQARVEAALRGTRSKEIKDRCHGQLTLARHGDDILVSRTGTTSVVALYQLGLPLLRRICDELGT